MLNANDDISVKTKAVQSYGLLVWWLSGRAAMKMDVSVAVISNQLTFKLKKMQENKVCAILFVLNAD